MATANDASIVSSLIGVFDYEPVTAAQNAQDLIDEVSPYSFQPDSIWKGEEPEAYALRCAADAELHKLLLLRHGGTGMRSAFVLGLKNYFLSGQYMNSTLVKANGGLDKPEGWLEDLAEYLNTRAVMSDAQKSLLNNTLGVVIPEVERFGMKITDHALASLFDESGAVSIGNAARYSVSLINRARKGAGVTKDHAQLVYNAFTTGNNEDLMKLKTAAYPKTGLAHEGKIPAQCFIEEETCRYEIVVSKDNYEAQRIIERLFDVKPYGSNTGTSD